jgi:hypothetical protein
MGLYMPVMGLLYLYLYLNLQELVSYQGHLKLWRVLAVQRTDIISLLA